MGRIRFNVEQVFEAVRDVDPDRALELIDADESLLDATDATQNTPLVLALKHKQLELARQLIERRANVFVVNHAGRWAMRLMVERNALKRADRERLVEAAIAAGVWDAEIFHAVWRRDHARAKAILASDAQQATVRLADPSGEDGYYNTLPYCGLSPLHYAVLAGDKRMTRLLLDSGAEVDAVPHAHPTDSRYTPMLFVPTGCGAIAQLLVDSGANVRHSAFYLNSGSKSMREVVVAGGAAGPPLMAALCLGQLDKATEIARDDPSVIEDRLPGAYIDTPLHMAVQAGCTAVVEALINHGMDVDTRSSGGQTALAMASDLYCSLDMFQLLVESGADVHTADDAPLYGAIWQHAYRHWNYESVIRYLVGKGARPRGLYHCTRAGNFAATKLLLELGADVNDTRDDGWPALNAGHTALDYCTGVAGEMQHSELAGFLRRQGAKHAAELDHGR